MEFGQLVVFRKGKSSAPYELDEGEHSIGSSMDSNIRLKFSHPLLLETHALIRVSSNGVATIINKSVGAPVRVNEKVALKPTILRHEDTFEILDKVFQYFNEHLKNEPEDSEKFITEKKNNLAKGRQSVNPLMRTPAKKSPTLKTKIPSIRKSASAVSKPSKSLQVIITPNKKLDNHVGSKTTSKIIVSKALVSPRSAKKRRLSLDNANKASRSPKISSRNILLSKSTINITISEEHEYSEVTPSTSMRTIQDEGESTKGRTPKRSVKVENTDTPNKDISVALIDFNSPSTLAQNSPRRGRPSSVRRASLQHQSALTTENSTNELTSNEIRTPVNKRIQSLKTVRHSLKKDTPPPRLTLPKVTIQPPTPQGTKVTDISSIGNSDEISVTFSPNAEPSTHNLVQKESITPRRSTIKKYKESDTPANKSRVSFAIEAPTGASPVNLEALNEGYSIDEDNEVSEKNNLHSSRKSRGERSVLHKESSTSDVQHVSRRSTKSKQSLASEEIERVLELPKGRRSSRYSLNSTKKLDDSLQSYNEVPKELLVAEKSPDSKRWSKTGQILLNDTPDDSSEEQENLLKRTSFRNIIISASTEGSDAERRSLDKKSGQRSNLIEFKVEDPKSSSKSPKKLSNSRNTSTSAKVHDDSILSENDKLAEPLHDSSIEEMDELQIPELDQSTDSSESEQVASDIDENLSKAQEKSLNISTRSTKLNKSASFSANGNNALNSLEKSTRVSMNGPRTSNNMNRSDLEISKNAKLQKSSSPSEDEPDSDGNLTRSSRVSRNASFPRSSIERSANTSQIENATVSTVNKSSRLSRSISRRNTKIGEAADASQSDNIATDLEHNVNRYSRSSRSPMIEGTGDYSQAKDIATDAEENANKSLRVSRNISRKSSKIATPTVSSQSEDEDKEDINKSSRLSRNTSRRSSKIKVPGNSSQTEQDADEEGNVNKCFRVSINSSRNTKMEGSADCSQTKDIATDAEENVNSSRVSRNVSRRSSKIKAPAGSYQIEENTTYEEDLNKSNISRNISKVPGNSSQIEQAADEEGNVNKGFRVSINSSRSTKMEGSADCSQTKDIATDAEENINSSRVSRNVSRRSSKIKAPAGSYQIEENTTYEEDLNKSKISRNISKSIEVLASSSPPGYIAADNKDNLNKSSRMSRSFSRKSIKVERSRNSSQIESSAVDATEHVDKSSRASKNFSKRSLKVDAAASSYQTEDNITDEEGNVNKSSILSRKAFRRSAKIGELGNALKTENNITGGEENTNESFRVSRNTSGRSKNSEQLSSPLLTEYDSTYAEGSLNKSTTSSKNNSRIANVSAVQGVQPVKTPGRWSRRSTKVMNSQSSIDSAETTMDVQQKNGEGSVISNTVKNISKQGFSLFDESTQEAKSKDNDSKNGSRQRVSIFDESTKEDLQEFNESTSTKPISILDDTQEVLSPVRPLSPRKSVRNIQNQDLDGSISPSTQVSSMRLSLKSATSQDSSLNTTGMDQSSSSVISVSSQSFSSFKRSSSRRKETRNETEIDVVNISSTLEAPEVKKSFRASGGNIKSEDLEESNSSRSTKRQSRTSEMFKDVSCTSTPFHKQNLSKKSRDSNTTSSKKSTKNKKGSSPVSGSKRVDMISISSSNDSVFLNSSAEKRSSSISNVSDQTEPSRRSSSRRSSIITHGEHNCISCRNSSVKRSSSVSVIAEPSVVEKSLSTSSRPSKTPRTSSGDALEQSYEETSPVKRVSSSASTKMSTPLLHRKSLRLSLSEKTPEKTVDTEDETPKSSIKPARRSSKANRSAYNPVLEDITPVTPEKLAVSGFTENVFKTPINTPGLFENIRKSVIRSRKRHRESTGSTMKDSKRARVDFAQEEQLETSESQRFGTPKPQKSPKNDLTNVDGVKEIFSTPKDQAKSPKKDPSNIPDLRRLISPKRQTTPRNDLLQIPDLKMITSPKEQNNRKSNRKSSVGDKQLLNTSRVQKDVSEVPNSLNVSGIEVLHQGSDIENSEDLFTKLTGKRPVRAYPRGKSLSPSKEQQEQSHSRKTMGDIPICSPRVQQWVEDHANVMYTSIGNVPGVPLSEDEEVLFNVSEKPKRRSKTGRSVSPKKPTQEKKDRRKTQGDALRNSPNVTKWKTEQANTRRSSAARNIGVKTEILSPNPVQTFPTTSTKAEKVTPQQPKSKTEVLTPRQQMTPLGNSGTPASIKAGRGRTRKVIEKQQKVTSQDQESTAETARKYMTPLGESATPASVKARRGRPKKEAEDQQQSTEEKICSLKDAATPASAKAKRGRRKKVAEDCGLTEGQKEIVTSSSVNNETTKIVITEDESPKEIGNKPLEALKRGRGKRIMSNEELLDVVSSTTASPAKPLIKRSRTRKGIAIIKDQEEEEIATNTRTRKGKVDFLSEPVSEDVPISRSRRAQKQSESEPIVASEVKKPARGRSRKNNDIEATPEINVSPVRKGGRRGQKTEEDTPMENEPTHEKGNILDVQDKPPSRSRRGKRIDEKQDPVPMEDGDVQKEATHKKPAAKGRVIKKNVAEQQGTDNTENGAVKKAISKGKKGQKMDEENQVDKIKPVSGRRGKKIDVVENVENKDMSDQTVEVEVKKRAPRGKRGKKEESLEEPEVKKPFGGKSGKKTKKEEAIESQDDHIEVPVVEKTTRSRKVKKVEENQNDEEKISQPNVKEVKPKGRGQKNNQGVTEETTDTEVEFKKPARAKPKKDESQASSAEIVAETGPAKKTTRRGTAQKKEQANLTPSSPEVKVRGKRGVKVFEDVEERMVTEKAPAKRGRGRKVNTEESESEQETDDAKVELSQKGAGSKGKKETVELEKPIKKVGKGVKTEGNSEVMDSPKKHPTRDRGKKVTEKMTDDDQVSSQSSQKQNTRMLRNKIIEEVIEMDVDSPRTARAKRGVNKKYSTDEYEVAEKKGGSKRKVRFEEGSSADANRTPEIDTRKSKRTRK